ncbi:hypothetical protein [Streptomyces sp. NPDC054887]
MLRITAAAKALLLAVFALLSLTAATGDASATPSTAGPAHVTALGTAPPVAGSGSCSPAESDVETRAGHARRAQRPQDAPQTALHAASAPPAAPVGLPHRALPDDGGAPHPHAPSRSGDLPVALQVFRC